MSDERIFPLAEDYISCPICGMDCRIEEEYRHAPFLQISARCRVFFCLNPLAGEANHYYSHIVEKDQPERIAAQKFYVDLGNRGLIVTNNYKTGQSIIRYDYQDAQDTIFDFLLIPDFPSLSSLKKKVRTVLTFL